MEQEIPLIVMHEDPEYSNEHWGIILRFQDPALQEFFKESARNDGVGAWSEVTTLHLQGHCIPLWGFHHNQLTLNGCLTVCSFPGHSFQSKREASTELSL